MIAELINTMLLAPFSKESWRRARWTGSANVAAAAKGYVGRHRAPGYRQAGPAHAARRPALTRGSA